MIQAAEAMNAQWGQEEPNWATAVALPRVYRLFRRVYSLLGFQDNAVSNDYVRSQ